MSRISVGASGRPVAAISPMSRPSALGVEIGGPDQEAPALGVLLRDPGHEVWRDEALDPVGQRPVSVSPSDPAEDRLERVEAHQLRGVGFGVDLGEDGVELRAEEGERRDDRAGGDAGDDGEDSGRSPFSVQPLRMPAPNAPSLPPPDRIRIVDLERLVRGQPAGGAELGALTADALAHVGRRLGRPSSGFGRDSRAAAPLRGCRGAVRGSGARPSRRRSAQATAPQRKSCVSSSRSWVCSPSFRFAPRGASRVGLLVPAAQRRLQI